jgi:hypothetical protein
MSVSQLGVFGAVGAVDFVVGAHHGPGLGLGNGRFKGRQVNLAQRAFVHLSADRKALKFLVVAAKCFSEVPTPLL